MTRKNAAIRVQIQRPDGLPIKKVFLILALILCGFSSTAQDRATIWTDSVLQTMSPSEKIGQLFLISSSASLSKNAAGDLSDNIKSWSPGIILVTGGGPAQILNFSRTMNSVCKIPLMMGINATAGAGDVLDSTMQFLNPMTIAAVKSDSMVYKVGAIVGRHMKLLGLHINFGPNISLYPRQKEYKNYFGDDVRKTEQKTVQLIRGLHDAGVLSCVLQSYRAPGKMANGKDSVFSYDQNSHTETSIGLTPEVVSLADGIITSQFPFTVVEKGKELTAPLAGIFIKSVLKESLSFKGLTFCDVSALKFSGKKKKKGEAELDALLAGNDVLMNPENISAAIRYIQKAMKKNKAISGRIDESVKRILLAKYAAGLSGKDKVDRDNLFLKLNLPEDKLFKHQLAENAVVVVRNSGGALPIKTLEDRRFSFLSVGSNSSSEFAHYLSKYNRFGNFVVQSPNDTVGLQVKLSGSDVIVVGFFPAADDFQASLLPMLQKLSRVKQVVLCFFGNPLALRSFSGFPTLVAGISDDPLIQKITAQILFGGISAKGVLPVTINSTFRSGDGVVTGTLNRLSYTLPEAAGMDSRTLDQIKSIANEAIDMKATPGCEVLIARNGKVISEQVYGYLTYDKKSPVTDQTIYDLASVTKVSATLQTVMFMYEKGLIDVNKKASVYLPELRNSNKKDFTIKDILTHQAGLWPFLPFWAQTVKDTVHLPEYYSKTVSPDYPYPVAPKMYASRGMRDSLWHWIIASKIQEKNGHVPYDYKYSDMGFYIMQHLAERLLNQPMDEFLQQNFYEVLGASTTGFLPLDRFPPSRIAPTEDDKLFRRSLLVGYVHDQGAAMSGGVAGHAGLFSTINDLAKLGQMWLQKGSYGGHQFFKPETIDFFTKKQFDNSRRGLGWDKPVVSDPNGPTSAYASAKTFGHTGFTGISIWIDPEFDLVFIFFSNRVYPEMTNNKILNANIRPRVQDVVYRSIFKYCENHN